MTLNDVTVSCGGGTPTCPAGLSKSGGLVLRTESSTIGKAWDPTGSNSQAHFTVISGTGDLRGVTGHGVTVTHTQGTVSYTNYWIELTFSNHGE